MYCIEHRPEFWHLYGSLKRFKASRMNYYENRVKELCAKALSAQGDELQAVLTELRAALREHAISLENAAYSYPILRRDPEVILS